MSIPPLVCSTPPPPDQCEDDKDHDEYELPYNLSQEDDENNDYDFGNYPTYNHFNAHEFNKLEDIPSKSIKPAESRVTEESTDTISVNSENENYKSDTKLKTKDASENKLDNDEDFDIEDLNLKLDSESPSSSLKDSSSGDEINKHENSGSLDSTHIPKTCNSESPQQELCLPTSNVELDFSEHIEYQTSKFGDNEKVNLHEQSEADINIDDTSIEIILDKIAQNENVDHLNEQPLPSEDATNDDFEDFDEFKYIAPERKNSVLVDECENPWENKDVDDSEFGNFTANFDNNEITFPESIPSGVSDEHSELDCPDIQNDDDDDDSFGDFDDFQSSGAQVETKMSIDEVEPSSTVPVLNFHSTENEAQIMDSINKVLSSVFTEEISEPISETEIKLESLLSETWGHLTETDVRQPYIVNWNSSLGQKTLLKALCIDSRNILFGPKWSHNMPKYAANLSNAPLQPQKQLSSIPQPEVPSSEKTAHKSNNWSDPFSTNGQESCNAESDNHGAESRSTDLAVFESSMPTKSDKIYSNTLSVQPIRQINLPDTHIFTPTDSETPRSKTIHYDSNPTSLLPQVITDKHKNMKPSIPQSSHSSDNKVVDDDYWEFQEFKTTPPVNHLPDSTNQTELPFDKSGEIVTLSNPMPKPSMAYQTQLLQPIKIEPSMPTLNWPDPGEVKEEFDVFSDFVSTTSWPDKNFPNSPTEVIKPADVIDVASEIRNIDNQTEAEIINSSRVNNMDDDGFNTFQSALPPINKSVVSNTDSSSNEPTTSSLPVDIDNHFDFKKDISTDSSVKTDTISFENTSKSNESSPNTFGFMTKTPEPTTRNSPSMAMGTQLPMNLLQPIPACSTTILPSNQQKNGQILQPLSLESYSQINWPSPGIDLQDLSRFNPVETLHSLKSDLSVSGPNRNSPIHNSKPVVNNQVQEDDVWGEFVSSKPSSQPPQTKKQTTFADDDEWTDFVSSPSVKPHNGLNTISLNVHTNSNIQKTNQNKFIKSNQMSLDIPTLNYITPKTNNHKSYNDRHFQNL